ncbi:MAG: hypothetical protein Q8R28_23910, partial [Dehalococcoidia bacterium]|nr:hypothetical protein [Dehalococcoidia bacterium]
MIIDSFTHMLPESYLDRLASVPGEAVKKMVSSICRVFEGAPHAFDPVRRVELLDKYQIDLQVVTLT